MKQLYIFLPSITILTFLLIGSANAQSTWQQEVHYNIDVKLNDTLHTLEGVEHFKYFNNSPDTLRFLYLHLWPNAYKNDRTAFNKQKVGLGDTKFNYSKASERGYIKNLLFTVNDRQVSYSDYNSMEDVILLNLPEPLLPGNSVDVSTPFLIRIPKVFSRMGHGTQDYQITQWYIKPAVYDAEGWHPMPYLDQGEFYSEYGKFDVNLTVPKNYVVACTGDIQTESEKQFLEERIEYTKNVKVSDMQALLEPIKSDYNYKTINIKQENIHDFAWFADKNFLVEKSEQLLGNGKKVASYAYYLPQNATNWKGQTEAINYTVKFLSDSVGNYPYSHASAVDGGLLAGSGMEYPNVTVVGKVGDRKTLTTVIIHEVGHNWFYGLLGSNERDYAWMDEGFNTFYEQKIDKAFNKILVERGERKPEKLSGFTIDNNTMLPLINSQHKEWPASMHSNKYGALAYGLSVYHKAAGILKHLEAYLGGETFGKCMKAYFDTYQYKHPRPIDVQNIFEKTSGKNLESFFVELMPTTNQIDFKIASVKSTNNVKDITIINKTKTNAPALITLINNKQVVEQLATEPFTQKIKISTSTLFDKIVLDYNNVTSDVNMKNNFYNTKGLLKKHAFKLRPIMGFKNYTTRNIYIAPYLSYNYYDGLMPGLVLHNIQTVQNKFTYFVAPSYGVNSNTINGAMSVALNLYPKKTLENITLMLSASSFSQELSKLNTNQAIIGSFSKIVPKVIFTLPNSKYPIAISRTLTLQHNIIGQQNIGYSNLFSDSLYRPYTKPVIRKGYTQATYSHNNARTLNPFKYTFDAHGNTDFVKLSATGNIKMNYNMPKRSLHVRGFAGKMVYFTPNAYDIAEYRFTTTATSANDYLYNNYYIGRNAYRKALTNQVEIREGGAKISTPLLSNPVGMSDNILLACNIASDLPFKKSYGLRLYADVATTKNKDLSYGKRTENTGSAGIQLNILQNLFQINCPLIMSNNYKEYYRTNYGKNYLVHTMSFTLSVNGFDLYKLRNNNLVNKLF